MLTHQPRLPRREDVVDLVLDPLWRPSAIRTRTAVNRAFSLPLVLSRQLTFFHLASASMFAAGIDNGSGMCR
jgi:hypothetical protein